jgi:hypothetical protein
MDQTDLKNQKLETRNQKLISKLSIGRRHHHRRLGRQIFSKEVLYPVLFAIAIGAILAWRLFNGA